MGGNEHITLHRQHWKKHAVMLCPYGPCKKQYVVVGLDANAGLMPTELEEGQPPVQPVTCGGDPNKDRD
eukprot:11683098-Prorocentrum_lima.AAC.1